MPEIITDAELVKKFAEQMTEVQEPEVKVETKVPEDTTVTLPGGYLAIDKDVVKTAEVRELNGADEEAIAKSGSISRSLNTLLSRGLVKIGSEDVTSEHLDNLLSGDRDAILLAIRRVTFGKDFDLIIRCPHCGEQQGCSIDLIKDIPVKSLKNPSDRIWTVKTGIGVLKLTLPTGSTQKKLMDSIDKTSAEVNTILLGECILAVDDRPVVGSQAALSLGMADRAVVINEILDRNPGPRLGEVKKSCKACGSSIDLPLGLTDLFRL